MGDEPAFVRALVCKHISVTSGPIAIKFNLKHHWDGERLAILDQNSGFHGNRGARWLSGRASESGEGVWGFETCLRRTVPLT